MPRSLLEVSSHVYHFACFKIFTKSQREAWLIQVSLWLHQFVYATKNPRQSNWSLWVQPLYNLIGYLDWLRAYSPGSLVWLGSFFCYLFLSETRNILEKEKVQEEDGRSSPLNTKNHTKDLTPLLYMEDYTYRLPQISSRLKISHCYPSFELQTQYQLSCITLSGTPLKVTKQEAHKDE